MASTASTNSPLVVIVGAGIGGAACAYYLRRELPGANVTVLEAQERVGGRIKDATFFGRTVNLGAAVFNAEQRNIAELSKELKMTTIRLPSSDGYPSNFILDGKDLIQTKNLMEQEQDAEAEMRRSLEAFLSALAINYQSHEQETFDSVPGYLKAGGLKMYANKSINEFFSGAHVNDAVKKYAIETLVREFFGQGLEGNAILSMMCLAGLYQDAFKIEGGMSRLVHALLHSSGSNLYLNSRVKLVRKLDSGQMEVVHGQTGNEFKVIADVVVIAAPFEWTGIQYEGFQSDLPTTQPSRMWQRLYYYVSHVAAKSIRSSYFKKGPASWTKPLPLLTTSNTIQPWVTIRSIGSSEGYTIYRIFSSVDIATDGLVQELFAGVQDYISNQWEYVYPLCPPITEESVCQSIVLDDHLYGLNGLESIATQMEMSVISGRNVAKLIAKGK